MLVDNEVKLEGYEFYHVRIWFSDARPNPISSKVITRLDYKNPCTISHVLKGLPVIFLVGNNALERT